MSSTCATSVPACATAYVPGSISSRSFLPVRAWKASSFSEKTSMMAGRSASFSSPYLRTLYPPPISSEATSGKPSATSRAWSMTSLQTLGSAPEPICIWSLVMRMPLSRAISFASCAYSCHMPKLALGPPVLVRLLCPRPIAGFMRTPTSFGRPAAPANARSWFKEVAT